MSNDDATLRKYLNEVGKIPLLSDDEVLKLAKRIKHYGDKSAIMELVEHNLLLVASIALDYTARDIPAIDLIEDGNFGLFLAAKNYDYEKGVKFSTYATLCIKQRLASALPKYNNIVVPKHVEDDFKKIIAVKDLLSKKYQRNITDEDIALHLNYPITKIRNIRSAYADMVSLDLQIGDDEENTLSEIIEDERVESFSSNLEDNYFKETLMKTFDILTDQEREVLLYRYPLNGGDKKKLIELSKMYGVTTTRIGQIEKNAIKKLKGSNKLRKLVKDYEMDFEF